MKYFYVAVVTTDAHPEDVVHYHFNSQKELDQFKVVFKDNTQGWSLQTFKIERNPQVTTPAKALKNHYNRKVNRGYFDKYDRADMRAYLEYHNIK